MLTNLPFIYISEEHDDEKFHLYVNIKLQGYKIDENRIEIIPIDFVNKHDNPNRAKHRDHPYYNDALNKITINIYLDKDAGNNEEWHKCFPITYDEIKRMERHRAEFVQIHLFRSDDPEDHDGTSSGHFGDAD